MKKYANVEHFVHSCARAILPFAVIKRVTPLYYASNRWRFKFMKRPILPQQSAHSRPRREAEGFFERYCQGKGIDIGWGGDPITPDVRGWDIEDGDAHLMAGVENETYDFVYSSHCLEHLEDIERALQNWWRILKPGGFLILYLPERDLFEKKKELPSRFSLDHKHFFLLDADDPPDTVGLLPLIERTLSDYRMEYAKICDYGLTIRDPFRHSDGEYSIEAVLAKETSV
ncbi:MAG: class I SAM-dependent methyltransferase [Verrucomicrobia bacterium]|nr:class I SAM-dependent methyltransferase [Verrucomicrobiota bacterium]